MLLNGFLLYALWQASNGSEPWRNVLAFAVWVIFAATLFLVSHWQLTAEECAKNAPKTPIVRMRLKFCHMAGWALMLGFAWNGWFGLATAELFGLTLRFAITSKSDELRKELAKNGSITGM